MSNDSDLKERGKSQELFQRNSQQNWQICRCGGGKEENVKNDLNFLSLCGLSDTMGQRVDFVDQMSSVWVC